MLPTRGLRIQFVSSRDVKVILFIDPLRERLVLDQQGLAMSIRRFFRWVLGGLVATLLVGLTSPLFVRSYLPRVVDPVRQVVVLQAGQPYRWRSEGYATTWVGPRGMPGRQSIPPMQSDAFRIAIWGDSQAEGVCVADAQKLHTQLERAAAGQGRSLVVLPFARSGDDGSDWISQMPRVETAFHVDQHLLLLAQWEDLAAVLNPPKTEARPRLQSRLATTLPAFVIEAARRLVSDANDQPRKLRFSPGPMSPPAATWSTSKPGPRETDWGVALRALAETTRRPIVIVYAPVLPHITAGQVRSDDPQESVFRSVQAEVAKYQITLVDVREAMRESARQGRWPHGFHHGRIGSGHLNPIGYRLIADQIVDAL